MRSKRSLKVFYVILVLSLVVIGMSYAVFNITTPETRVSKLTIGNMLYGVSIYEETTPVTGTRVTVPASTTKTYYVQVYSINNIDSKYALAYKTSGTGVTVSVSDRTEWNTSGSIAEYNGYAYSKAIKVFSHHYPLTSNH